MYQEAIVKYIKGPLLEAINANRPATIGEVTYDNMAGILEFPLPKGFHGLATPYYEDDKTLPISFMQVDEIVFDRLYIYELTMIPEFDAKKWINIVLKAYQIMEKKEFMMRLIDEFKVFVSDSMDDGFHETFDDHLKFLEACATVFAEKKGEE